ncbi:MAG TPA: M15 family metallopeptidase [Clostridia bacterium]|nr:M15 family metallopeptidase [Clostridia bacterium]
MEDLFKEAARAGYTLYAVSGYRSYALQSSVYRSKVSAVGEKRAQLVVARPGTSEHQTGLAMDINGKTTLSQGLVEAFGNSPEGRWVADQAHRFGFIVRYPRDKTDRTGYSWEPWHLRYVGVGHATAIYVMDVTLEEYVALLKLRAWTDTWPAPLRWVLGIGAVP